MSVYTLFYKKPDGKGASMCFSNLARVADFDENLNYHSLVHHFTRKRKVWYEDPYKGVMVIKSPRMEKGLQRVHRQGRSTNLKSRNL